MRGLCGRAMRRGGFAAREKGGKRGRAAGGDAGMGANVGVYERVFMYAYT